MCLLHCPCLVLAVLLWQAALHAAGLRGSALGRSDVGANPEVPDWLKKWAALTLQFVQKEKELLPAVRVWGGSRLGSGGAAPRAAGSCACRVCFERRGGTGGSVSHLRAVGELCTDAAWHGGHVS